MKFHRPSIDGINEKTLNSFMDYIGELNENNLFNDFLEECQYKKMNKKQKQKLKRDLIILCKKYIENFEKNMC